MAARADKDDRELVKLGDGRSEYLTQSQIQLAVQLSELLNLSAVTTASLVVESEDLTSHPHVLEHASRLTQAVFLYLEAERMYFTVISTLLEGAVKATFGTSFNELAHAVLSKIYQLNSRLVSALFERDDMAFEAKLAGVRALDHGPSKVTEEG